MTADIHKIHAFLKENSNDLKSLSLDLWDHPELAWEEKYASQAICNFLQKNKFQVQTNYLGLPTSFRTEFGSGGRTFAVAAEYDALPDIGHGCGHNLIATAAVAATLAVRHFLTERHIQGRFVLLGTPAEESSGGKVVMLEKNCLKGIDAAMMVHPSWRNTPDPGSTSFKQYLVEFHGVSAHAAATPELGINALDAVTLLFAGISAYRQQLSPLCSIHGIIKNGGEVPNIIPAEASCLFYLRSVTDEGLAKLDQRFQDIVRGAALMTGCQYLVKENSREYRARRPNAVMNAQYIKDMEALGNKVVHSVPAGKGSSDFGNFSHVVPGIHPYFAVADHEVAGHSIAMAEASKTDYAFESMLCAAATMAHTAMRFLAEDDFAAEVTEGFIPD